MRGWFTSRSCIWRSNKNPRDKLDWTKVIISRYLSFLAVNFLAEIFVRKMSSILIIFWRKSIYEAWKVESSHCKIQNINQSSEQFSLVQMFLLLFFISLRQRIFLYYIFVACYCLKVYYLDVSIIQKSLFICLLFRFYLYKHIVLDRYVWLIPHIR